MKLAFWQRLDLWARNISPVGLTFVLIVLSAIPFHIPEFGAVAPTLALMSVFHWTVYRPDLFPAWAVFLVGVFHDALSGAPLGLNAIVFLTTYGVILSQRRFFLGKSFPVVWLGFAIVAVLAEIQGWVLISAFHSTPLSGKAFFFQYLLSVSLFPVFSWGFGRWQQTFLR